MSVTFGPCSRFRLDNVYHEGQLVGHTLWDAERPDVHGHATRRGAQFRYAADAFAFAARLVPAVHQEATAAGLLFKM